MQQTPILPTEYRPQSPEDFIGSARAQALWLQEKINTCLPLRIPIRIIILGPPGTGKSSLSNYAGKLLGVSKFSIHKYNGTQLNLDLCNELAKTCAFTDLLSTYRLIQLEEVDKATPLAQVRFLTNMDDIGNGNCIIATTNRKLAELELRNQSRWQYLEVHPPTDQEVMDFLITKFGITPNIANQIATFAAGCVRQACNDADTYLIQQRVQQRTQQ